MSSEREKHAPSPLQLCYTFSLTNLYLDMKKSLLLCFWAFVLCLPAVSFGQKTTPDSTAQVVVRTTDDNEFVGYVVSETADAIVLRTASMGDVNIRRRNIRRLRPVGKGQIVNGEFWSENPHTTRYYFQSNGYGLREGEGYYQNTWVFYNQVSYGITDNFTLGVGMVPLFLFGADAPTPVWLTPKISIPVVKDKFNIGTGAFIGTVLGDDGGGAFGIVYGNTTFGPRERNLTLGLGYGFAGGEWSNYPTLSLSGMARAGKKFAFISENYFLSAGSETVSIISVGGRFIGRKVSIDAALFSPIVPDQDFFFAFPWLGINVPFGKEW